MFKKDGWGLIAVTCRSTYSISYKEGILSLVFGGIGGDMNGVNEPRDLDVERRVIKSIVEDVSNYWIASDRVREGYFSCDLYGHCYAACSRLIEMAQPVHRDALQDFLKGKNRLDEALLHEFLEDVLSPDEDIGDFESAVQTLCDLFLKRELMAVGKVLVEDTGRYPSAQTPKDILDKLYLDAYDLAGHVPSLTEWADFRSGNLDFLQSLEDAYKQRRELVPGISTGVKEIDDALGGGLRPGEVTVIAGRPCMGKTDLAIRIAYSSARTYMDTAGKSGAVVGLFSMKWPERQIIGRIVSCVTDVHLERFRSGDLSSDEFSELVQASQDMHRLPLFLRDSTQETFCTLSLASRHLKRQHNLGLIVIDGLQVIQKLEGDKNLSQLMAGLRYLAKDMNVPIVITVGLGREIEEQAEKRPTLRDLANVGINFEDIDASLLLYREDYYLERARPVQEYDGHENAMLDAMAEWEDGLRKVRNHLDVHVTRHDWGTSDIVTVGYDIMTSRYWSLGRI